MNHKTRIEELLAGLYREGKVTFGEMVAIFAAVSEWKPNDEERSSYGSVAMQALCGLNTVQELV